MTAVQWLLEELRQLDKKVRSYKRIDYIKKRQSIIKQANEMFEKQIIETWHNGYNNQSPMIDEENCGQQYYSETYKNQKYEKDE